MDFGTCVSWLSARPSVTRLDAFSTSKDVRLFCERLMVIVAGSRALKLVSELLFSRLAMQSDTTFREYQHIQEIQSDRYRHSWTDISSYVTHISSSDWRLSVRSNIVNLLPWNDLQRTQMYTHSDTDQQC